MRKCLPGLVVLATLGCGPGGAAETSTGHEATQTTASETATETGEETETGDVELPAVCQPAPVEAYGALGEFIGKFGVHEDCTIVAVDEVELRSTGTRFVVTTTCPELDPFTWELGLDPAPTSFPLAPDDLVDIVYEGELYSHTSVDDFVVRDAETDALLVHWLNVSGCVYCDNASEFSPAPLILSELDLDCPAVADDCNDAASLGLELGLGDASLALTPAEPHGVIEAGELGFEAWLGDHRRGWLLACLFGDLIDWTLAYAVVASG